MEGLYDGVDGGEPPNSDRIVTTCSFQ